MTIQAQLELKGWKPWENNHPASGVVHVMFLQSKVFPPQSVVPGDVEEILAGVLGDSKPDYWRETDYYDKLLARDGRV